MKAFVFLLVLANLLVYAFFADLLTTAPSVEAGRLAQQVNPQGMRIVARGEAPPAGSPVVEPQVASPEGAAAVPARAVVEPLCLAWGPLSMAEADRLAGALAGRFGDFQWARIPVTSEGNGWWVHVPPLADRAAAERKAGELRALGISDYFVIQEGPSRHAISLGVFSSEKGGRERLAELQAKGVRSARLGARPDKDGSLRLELRGPGEQRDALVEAIAGMQPKIRPLACK